MTSGNYEAQVVVPAIFSHEPLPKLPLNSADTLPSAVAFARSFLACLPAPPEPLTFEFSADLLAGVLVECTHSDPRNGLKGWDDVLFYPIDPLWQTGGQMLTALQRLPDEVMQHESSEVWINRYMKTVSGLLSGSDGGGLPRAAYRHWQKAMVMNKVLGADIGTVRLVESPAQPARTIDVFNKRELMDASFRVDEMHSDRQKVGKRVICDAMERDGVRDVPDGVVAAKRLDAKKLEFENLVEPLERLQTDLILASKMDPAEFRVSPLLLLGEPGIGKTFLATQLAEVLGVPCEKVTAGGAQGGFQLSGSDSSWNGSKPGAVFELLARSPSASPVLVIDEVEKIGSDARYPMMPVLLDLLDAGTAKSFRDDYFGMQFDASHLVVVLTANSIKDVPAPLLSRVEVFTVPQPEPEQRLRIIRQLVESLNRKTGMQIDLVDSGAAQLAEKVADLRQLNRQVTTAFAKVIQSGGQELDLGDKKVTAALQAALANMALPPGGRARMH